MSHRVLATLSVLVLPVLFAPTPTAGQGRTAANETWSPPQTPWGHADLQGTWSNKTITPLERPAELAGKQFLTDEELAVRQVGATLDAASLPMPTGAYNDFWLEAGVLSQQTSLIVNPPDGRLPPVTPTERQRESQRTDSYLEAADGRTAIDSWEDLNTYDRCIARGMPGLMLPGYYNHRHTFT